MNGYFLNELSDITGGYLSSEQIDLLTIIQCDSIEKLLDFTKKCDQINNIGDIFTNINLNNLNEAKRFIFKVYQSTMVYHDQSKEESRIRRFNYLKLDSEEDVLNVLNHKNPNSDEILSLNHHFVSKERDQNKAEGLYDELELLNSQLGNFNSFLIGSGKIYNVINKYQTDKAKRFDFYHAKRDLDFAYNNGKHVRFHSLLVKDNDSHLFDGKSKEEILQIIHEYVVASIDFITEYNNTHKININGVEEPIINAVDLFNEIVSFDVNDQGEYYNIWESKYGITIADLMNVFKYAKENKPEGVSYLYNEPFLENDQRRLKVLETLISIDQLSPGLIDTLGSQMHITIELDNDSYEDKITRCFSDFKKLQDMTSKKIQITEYDMSLGRNELSKVYGTNASYDLNQVYEYKKGKNEIIAKIIKDSGVVLSGVSYWSLTDGIDSNLERIRSDLLNKNIISDIKQLPTVCGGLYPTYKMLIDKLDESNKESR